MRRNREQRRSLLLRDKKYIQLERRRRELWDKFRESKHLVPYDKPIRHGWYRVFVWKNPTTIQNHPDYKEFEEIMHACSIPQWSLNKKFKYLGTSSHDYRNNKRGEPRELALIDLQACQWNKLSEKAKEHFMPLKNISQWGMYREYYTYRPLVPRSLLRIKVYPRYLYSYWEKDTSLESEIAELDNYIQTNYLLPKMAKAIGFSLDYDRFYNEERLKLLAREMKEELREEISYAEFV